jgi:glycosyltransferase involved in cell wall biosynthesis
MYERAITNPGVIVLHDALLHHFLLGALSREQYIEEFTYNYGPWRKHFAEALWDERAASGSDIRYFDFPMLRRVIEASKAVIVHNAAAAEVARAHGPADVHVVPHFVEQESIPEGSAALFREQIGIPQQATLFGILGFLRESKRLLPTIDAFLKLHSLVPNTALLIEGTPVSSDLNRLLAELDSHPAIYRTGYLSPERFLAAADALDCCINLRYPAAGETSGIAMRLMGLGKVVILTDGEQISDIPATACLRVTPGVAEPAELFDHMVMVSEFPAIARAIGDEARRHIRRDHSLEAAADRYWQILCAAASR